MKHFNKLRITFNLLFIAMLWSSIITAQPCGSLINFSSGITTGAAKAPNTWYPDRYPPAGFSSPATSMAGSNLLKLSISTADGAVNRPGGQQSTFYNTQGRQLDLIPNAQYIEVKLYVPASWATSNKRMAGVWGVALDAADGNIKYPIVEFTSATDADGTGPRFRGWEDGTSTWHNLGLPSGFAYDSWVTIKIAMSSAQPGQFTYTIGSISYITTTFGTSSVKIGSAILDGYNYDPTSTVNESNPGINYDIYWDDFTQSTKLDGLASLTIKDVNTNYYYCTIQSAIDDATTLTGHTIEVGSGTYNEQVVVSKGVNILGTGATKPIINFIGTVTGKSTLFDISAPSVTIDNFQMDVDLTKLSSAIIATGSNINGLAIKNNLINAKGSSAAASTGTYGNRNAISINYANYRVATGGVNNVSVLNNTITGGNDLFSVARYFRAGVDADEVGGTFDGNTVQSISQDIQVRFGSNGDINITNNHINGGGADVSGSNAGAGNINITGNTFDGTFGNTYSSSLRLKTNSNSKTTTVSGNTFLNHNWGISLESYDAVTIDNNTFTPLANSTTYRHITENTKEISSTSGFAQPIVGGIFTRNTFNGSGTTGGTAIAFYNHDNDNPVFQPFTIGTVGNENNFNAGIGTFIRLDNTTGPTGTGTSPNIVAAAGFPEYGGNVAITTMACWNVDLDIVNNKFNVGAGLQLPSAMSITQRAALEPVLFHRPDIDASCTGILAYYYPVHNITKNTVYPIIQSAIDAASTNDSIFIEAGIFTEQLSINKTLRFSGAGAGMCGTGSRPASETHLVAPNSGNLINLSGAVTVNFDGFEIDSMNIANITQPNQNLSIRNSLFQLNFLPSSNNLYFSSTALTLECNYFKAINGTNNGSSSHIFFSGANFTAVNNIFTSEDAINDLSLTTGSLPVWINLSNGANNTNINHNKFTKVDIGILIGNNAGNIKIKENEFSEAKRQTYSFGDGIGAGIVLFGNLTPIGPIAITNNKFYDSEDGIRTSSAGTSFPAPNLLKIAYNSFETLTEKAIAIGGSYSGSSNKLNAVCNWFGNITGPIIGTNVGANFGGMQIVDGGGRVMYKNWLNYGTDADVAQLGFQLPTTINVAPGNNVSQAENQYRVLSNAIGCAAEGQTLVLNGTFDFTNATAQAQWALGNNGVADNVGTSTGAGGDDYTITAPDSANNVTLTASSLGAATILGPGDLANASLETPLFFDSRTTSSSHKKWTISNLIFNNFDVGIIADHNGGPINVMDTFKVTNNQFYIPADLNSTVAPTDNLQNLGVHYNYGKGIEITSNQFFIDGTGVSDDANSKRSVTVAIQSATSGSTAYDGLKIINNTFAVSGQPAAQAAVIRGIWENGANTDAAILIDSNKFTNTSVLNTADKNRQTALWVTSVSGANKQVVYKNNEVSGFYEGIAWIGGPYTSNAPQVYATGSTPVQILNNKFNGVLTSVVVRKDPSSANTGSPANIYNNSFSNYPTNGLAIRNEGSGATAASCNWYDTLLVANVIKNTGGGSIVYIPKLSNGNDGDVATGFQLDGANTCVFPVANITQGTTYATIQAAVNAANANDSIFVMEGIYPENVLVNKALKITGRDSALVIVDKGDANYLNDIDNIGFTITANNIALKKMKVRNYGNAVRSTVAINTLSLDSMSLIENYHNGFYTNQTLDSLVIKNSTLSYNGFKGGVRSPNSGFRRGIFAQSTSADFSRFNIHDNKVESNGLVGIDINLSHAINGLVIQNNISRYNFDEQIGVWMGNNNETMGAVLVKGNTLTLSDSAHYGMEVRMPHGTTAEAGNGSVFIQGNTIGVVNHVVSVKDMAAIAIIRRKDNDGTIANDQPQGVVIKDNVISDFQNGSNSGSAFGIVVGGIGHRISGNTISNTQVPLQLQKGNENSGNNGNSGAPAVPNNEYFDRDNSSDACAEIGANTITTSGDSRIVTGPSTFSTILPPTPVTNTTIAVKFCSIQSAIGYSRTTSGNTIQADAGLYAEDIIVSKPLIILGPNSAINPCSGTRVDEAIVVPATKATSSGEVFHVAASNITISGFTINGDNPLLTSTYLGLNGADIDAAEGVTIYEPNINNLTVTNNIIKNLSYFGVSLVGNGTNTPTSGHLISNNIFQTMGTYDAASGIDRWGGGVLLSSNQYVAITNNCMDSIRLGIQTDNYFSVNPGAATYQVIDGNTMTNVRRTGIFHNLAYSSASPLTISNNSITGTANVNETKWDGVFLSSLSVPSTTSNNTITATAVPQISSGIEVWNVAKTTPATIAGGTVNNATRGIFVNNYDAYTSDATAGANAAISGITINNAAADTGILLYDNPVSSHIKVSASIGAGVTINNGTHGLVLRNDSTAISSMGNAAFAGQTGDYIRLINTKSSFDATTATFGGLTGATATLVQNFAIEDKITHKIDSTILGFVTVKTANDFVTLNSYFAPSTMPSVQRGVDAASTGFTVNVADGTYNGDVDINKSLVVRGQSTAAIIRGLYAGNANTVTVSAINAAIKNVTVTRDYGADISAWYASTKNQGISVNSSGNGLTVDSVLVTGNRNGIYVNNAQNVTISNSVVENNRTGLHFANNVSNGNVHNNFIRNNFTHGFLMNYDLTGGVTSTNLLVNNNSITGNWYAQINFQHGNLAIPIGDQTGMSFNCNWYGSLFPAYSAASAGEPGYTSQAPSQFGGTDPGLNSDIRGAEAARVNYMPYLQDGTDNDVAYGFQPVPNNCGMAPTKLYVNDTHVGTDVYTTTSGNDATGLGTPTSPFATISRAIAGAVAGDTIYVDGGSYVDTVNIYKKLQIRGANFGIDPNTGTRITESIIYPLTSNPVSNGAYIAGIAQTGAGTKIDGFTLDGDNPALTSAVTSNGANIDAAYGVVGIGVISNDTLSNNIVKNTADVGIVLLGNGTPTTGNIISNNKFDNITAINGVGAYLINNPYASVINNVMTKVKIGAQTNNFGFPDPGNTHSISNNTIESSNVGILHNNFYGGASNYMIANNTLNTASGASNNNGILILSMQSAVGATITNNAITGAKYGYNLWGNPTTSTLNISGGTLTNCETGVFANNYDGFNSNATSSIYKVSGVTINGGTKGIHVKDNSLNSNNATVAVLIDTNTIFSNNTTGLFVEGGSASASFGVTTPATFTGNTKYIKLTSNGTDVPTSQIDATSVTFGGLTAATATLAQNYDIEDKIDHKIDSVALGFVLVKANNTFVTTDSYITPGATAAKIQRGIEAASNGFNVNVKQGTYAENILVNKSVAMLGANVGIDASTRFGAFSSLKAVPTVETIVTAPVDNPTAGNPGANDLFRVIADNVTIDGFTIDGNNSTAVGGSLVGEGGTIINARRGITNIDASDGFNPVNNLKVRYNIIQNVAQRGVSLANDGPVSTGNSITQNVIRSFGADPINGGQAVILFSNAYADISNNTINVPHDQIGLHLQNFFTDGSMTWSGNNVTVGQNSIGLHANLFYPPASTFNISGNTVNAAAGVTGASDSTWGINMWGVQNGATVNINNNTVGSSGGTFARGINLWNLPSNKVTVSGGTVANSVVGVNLDNIDLYYGAGSSTMAKVTGTSITATKTGIRARATPLTTPPAFGSNTVNGSVSLTLDNATVNVTGNTKVVEVNAPASSLPNMATVYLTNGTAINNTATSDTAILVSGNQAQLYAAVSNIKTAASGSHNAIQFANITSGNTVSNLLLAGGTTINLNGNNTAKAFASPQYSIVEMDGTGWTAPDSAANGNQSVLIDGAMKFTSGILGAGNSTIEFGSNAADIMTGASPEKATSYILGNAKMLSRPVANLALDMLGVRLAAEAGANANVGNMMILRTTLASGSINPAFPANNSIRTVWGINPSNTSSSRGDVQFRYLNNSTNLNSQTPSSIYSYRYAGGQWNKVSASLNSSLVGDIYTTPSFGAPNFSPWTLSSQSSLDAPDLTPVITVLPPSFTPSTTSQPLNIKLFNIGTVATSGTGSISVFVLKPSTAFTNLTLTNDANGTGGWTLVDSGPFYTLTSIGSPIINGNFDFISITGSLNTTTGIPAGRYTVSASIANNSGGETNNANNSASTVINVSN